MDTIKREIFTQTDALLKTREALFAQKQALTDSLRGDYKTLIFMGCGSGYMLSCGGAYLFNIHTDKKAVALAGGEVLMAPDRYRKLFEDALVVVNSRSGETSEVVKALKEMAKTASFRTIGILAKEQCTMRDMMDICVLIPWAFDESVCQTRNISNFYYSLSMLYAFYADDTALADSFSAYFDMQRDYLAAIEPECKEIAAKSWNNVTVLADGEVCGVASEGALAFFEISILAGEYFNLLDYRHGPIVAADESKVVIVLLNPGETTHQKKMVDELVAHKSCVITLGEGTKESWGSYYHIALDHIDRYEVWGLPLVNLCQVLAFHKALANGHDPDRPEGLNPFVKL